MLRKKKDKECFKLPEEPSGGFEKMIYNLAIVLLSLVEERNAGRIEREEMVLVVSELLDPVMEEILKSMAKGGAVPF